MSKDNVDLWDSRELGASEEHAEVWVVPVKPEGLGKPKTKPIVKVLRDDDCEMMQISVGKKIMFEDNIWNFDQDIAISIMKEAGLTVNEESYTYDD